MYQLFRVKHFLALSFCLINVASLPGADVGYKQSLASTDLEPTANGTANASAVRRELIGAWVRARRSSRRALTSEDTPNSTNNGRTVTPRHLRENNKLEARRTDMPALAEPLKQDSAHVFPDDYVGKVSVSGRGGRPRQTFTARFDTTISELIIPGKRCRSQQGCLGGDDRKYDESGNTNNLFDRLYYMEGGALEAQIFEDAVAIQDLVVISQSDVYSVDYAAGGIAPVFEDSMTATMGLSCHKAYDSPIEHQNYIQQLWHEGQLKDPRSPEFSFFFGRTASGTQYWSELRIGGRNTNLFTPPLIAMESSQEYDGAMWEVPFQGSTVSINGRPKTSLSEEIDQGSALFDSAGALIVAPIAAADRIFSSLPGAFPINHNERTAGPPGERLGRQSAIGGAAPLPSEFRTYAYPCGSNTIIGFNLGSQSEWFDINPLDLNLGKIREDNNDYQDLDGKDDLKKARRDNVEMCLASIVGDPRVTNKQWRLGTSFLKNWYSIYGLDGNPHQITLAQAIDHPPNTPPASRPDDSDDNSARPADMVETSR